MDSRLDTGINWEALQMPKMTKHLTNKFGEILEARYLAGSPWLSSTVWPGVLGLHSLTGRKEFVLGDAMPGLPIFQERHLGSSTPVSKKDILRTDEILLGTTSETLEGWFPCKYPQRMVSHGFQVVRNGFCPSPVRGQESQTKPAVWSLQGASQKTKSIGENDVNHSAGMTLLGVAYRENQKEKKHTHTQNGWVPRFETNEHPEQFCNVPRFEVGYGSLPIWDHPIGNQAGLLEKMLPKKTFLLGECMQFKSRLEQDAFVSLLNCGLSFLARGVASQNKTASGKQKKR